MNTGFIKYQLMPRQSRALAHFTREDIWIETHRAGSMEDCILRDDVQRSGRRGSVHISGSTKSKPRRSHEPKAYETEEDEE